MNITSQLDPPTPPDSTELGDWTHDHDGYGRSFTGTVRGPVVIQGYQLADGTIDRSILINDGDGRIIELTDPQATAFAILAAHDEREALR